MFWSESKPQIDFGNDFSVAAQETESESENGLACLVGQSDIHHQHWWICLGSRTLDWCNPQTRVSVCPVVQNLCKIFLLRKGLSSSLPLSYFQIQRRRTEQNNRLSSSSWPQEVCKEVEIFSHCSCICFCPPFCGWSSSPRADPEPRLWTLSGVHSVPYWEGS